MHRSIPLYTLCKVKSTDWPFFSEALSQKLSCICDKRDDGKYSRPQSGVADVLMMPVRIVSVKGDMQMLTVLGKQNIQKI